MEQFLIAVDSDEGTQAAGLDDLVESEAVNCCHGTGLAFYWNLNPSRVAKPNVDLYDGALIQIQGLAETDTVGTVYKMVPETISGQGVRRRLIWIDKESVWVEVTPSRNGTAIKSCEVLAAVADSQESSRTTATAHSWDSLLSGVQTPSTAPTWIDWIVSIQNAGCFVSFFKKAEVIYLIVSCVLQLQFGSSSSSRKRKRDDK